MKLTLTTDDGILLGRWNIEEEFGDIRKPLPLAELTAEIREEYRRRKYLEDGGILDSTA